MLWSAKNAFKCILQLLEVTSLLPHLCRPRVASPYFLHRAGAIRLHRMDVCRVQKHQNMMSVHPCRGEHRITIRKHLAPTVSLYISSKASSVKMIVVTFFCFFQADLQPSTRSIWHVRDIRSNGQGHLLCRRSRELWEPSYLVLIAGKKPKPGQDFNSRVTKHVSIMAERLRSTLSLTGSFLMLAASELWSTWYGAHTD